MLGMITHPRKIASAALTTVSYLALMAAASAQSANPPAVPPNNSALPPVVVQSPQQRQAKPSQAKTDAAQRRIAARRARNPNAQPAAAPADASANSSAIQRAYAPVTGYVATESMVGTKTATPLLETPQSISVVTRDQIEDQNAQSAKQALRYTAGVQSETRANFGGYDITYGRGFALNRYLDGMRIMGDTQFITAQPEIYGLDRVEYLRGPASVLYGQGSPGGFINMISRMPQATSSNEVFIQGGSNDRVQGGFDSTGKLDKNGDFLYRVTGFAKDAGNQVDFVKEQRYYIAPALTWRPTKDTTWTVLANYQNDPSVGYYNFVPYRGSLAPNPGGTLPTSFYGGDPNFNDINRQQYSVTSLFEHRFDNGFTIRQNARYMDTWGNLKQVLPLTFSDDGSTLQRYAESVRDRNSAFTTDTQGEIQFGTGPIAHKVLLGVDTQTVLQTERNAESSDFLNVATGNFGPTGFPTALNVFSPVYYQPPGDPFTDPWVSTNKNVRQTLQQTGLYAQDQLKIGRLSVVGGARYDFANNGTTTTNYLPAVPTAAYTSQKDRATTGRVGAIYEFDSGVAPYVNYATSFDPTLGTTFDGGPFKPTTGTLYEAGVKYQPKGYKAFVQASIYELTQQNVLTADTAPGHAGFNVQTGEVRSRGFEIEGKASLNDNLDLIASFSTVDPTITKSTTSNLGKIPLYVPRTTAAAWGDYTIHGGAFSGLGFGLGVRHMGDTFADDANLVRVPSYTLVDGAIHYDLVELNPAWKGARLSVNATNLFDKTYVSQCTDTGNINSLLGSFGVPPVAGYGQYNDINCVYGLRRQVVATLRYRW